jgi:sugar lactone lactonase YvrE
MANRLYRMRQFRDVAAVTTDNPGEDPSQVLAANSITINGGVAVDTQDVIYFTDPTNHMVYKLQRGRTPIRYAGSPGVAGATNGIGTLARFSTPKAICVDKTGIVYVVDSGNNMIRRIDSSGNVSNFAPLTDGTQAGSIGVDSNGNVFIVDSDGI